MKNRFAVAAALAAALGAMLTTAPRAQAEVRVTGNPRALQVEADHASIEDVLAALRNAVGLNYRSAVKLDAPLNGRFSGSLDQLIVKLLSSRDYSFVYRGSATGPALEIVAGGFGAATALPPSAEAFAPRARVSRARRADATEALLWDETLRPGDVVVTEEGVRVFEGSWICPHAISEFRTLSETPDLRRQRRMVLAEIDRAMKIRDPGRMERPIVAADPESQPGR
jgi:hypothetical protein